MLDAVGVEPARLPELVRPGSVVGNLSAAAPTPGSPSGVLWWAGGMDQGVGAVAWDIDAGLSEARVAP